MRAVSAAAALALLAGAPACGGDPVVVPITLALDQDSCGTAEPDELLLSCAAAVGITVRSPRDGSIMEAACEDLPGAERTLAELPAVLSQIDLSGLTEPSIWLELGLFTPRSAADGCPAVGESRPEMALWAAETVELEGGDGTLVELACAGIDSSAGCDEECDGEYWVCSNDGGQTACSIAYQRCAESCDDGEGWCFSYCQGGQQECLESGGQNACSLVLDGCLIQCDQEYSGEAEEQCDYGCYQDHEECWEVGFCQLLRDECRDECGDPGAGACASLL